jgi:pSer/pThr/pTyr-binding forkhead associated (FHA) protein
VAAQPSRAFTIGRAPDCDLVLADDSVSRHHAEISVTSAGDLLLADCRSTHGTAIVERGVSRSISREVVRPGSTIRFGGVSMTVAELVDALRSRFPEFAAPVAKPPVAAPPAAARPAAAQPRSERRSKRWAGTRLVRCTCGAVKPRGQRCPECGE